MAEIPLDTMQCGMKFMQAGFDTDAFVASAEHHGFAAGLVVGESIRQGLFKKECQLFCDSTTCPQQMVDGKMPDGPRVTVDCLPKPMRVDIKMMAL